MIRKTHLPPTIVRSNRNRDQRWKGLPLKGSRPSTTRSANLPGSIEPSDSLRKKRSAVHVPTKIASSTLMHWLGTPNAARSYPYA